MDSPERETDTRRMKAILTLAAAIAFASAPLWSAGFGGFDPASFPIPQDDPPVQPAAYAFAIWGVIYLWLVASALFGLLRRAEDAGWDRTRWPLAASLTIGTPWISVAMVSPLWATALILAMLAAALVAFLRAPARDAWILAAPLGLYAGWLTAASAVSLGLLGAGYGFLVGEVAWAWIALLIALGLGLAISRRSQSPSFALALAWALIAVAVQNWGSHWGLVALALLGAAAIMADSFLRRR